MKTCFALVAAIAFAASAARADVKPASIFTDHLVLQQGKQTAIWGTADAGEKVTVTLGKQTQTAAAGADGKWLINLKDLSADTGAGPFDLVIAGSNTVTFKDVYVGEVWLCSGQSNMDFTVVNTPKYRFAGVANMAEEVKNANYPKIRMFSGEYQKSYQPQTSVKGIWKTVTPENVPEMSAIGYFFARDLQKELKVPVGIVTETFGASCAEAWVSRDALDAVPAFKPWLATFDTLYKNYQQTPTGKDPVQDQHNPTVMYNGMIAPIIPFTVKGVLWYQGESIAKPLASFPLVNETLVKDWRARWGNPDMPFYFCQLAGQQAASNRPEVREAQAALLSVPHTAMAVTTDIGEAKNVHPKNKQDVGDRLTRIALANTYGKKIEYSGPVYESMKVEGTAIRLSFTHVSGGLVAKGGELKDFTIAGKDGKFVPATARIDKETIVVSSPDVAAPANVRYAWEQFPETANLYNTDALPAPQFRTDKP